MEYAKTIVNGVEVNYKESENGSIGAKWHIDRGNSIEYFRLQTQWRKEQDLQDFLSGKIRRYSEKIS